MEINHQAGTGKLETGGKPKLWRYAFGFFLLAVIWVAVLELIIKPRILTIPGLPIFKKLGIYLLPPLLLVTVVYGLRCLYVQKKELQEAERQEAQQAQEESRRQEEDAREAALLEKKRFSLEILSLGIAVEYLRQGEIWEELQRAEDYDPVLSEDPEDYPSALEDKEKAQHEREAEVLERVLGWLNEEWAIPMFLAGPSLQNPMMQALLESNLVEALAYGEVEGRKLNVVESVHDETPDGILQKVFDFMERHTEVPAVLLLAEDGMALRHCLRAEDAPELLHDGPRPKDGITESVVALLLGRKERIEPMRAFIQCDATGDDPLKPYWEKEYLSRSAGAFKTTELLPSAWSKVLIERFGKLPVLGHLHRPQFAIFQGSVGDGTKASALQEAWEAAQNSLGGADQHRHLFYDLGPVSQGRKLAPLSRAMNQIDPDFDVFDRGINLFGRLGDTGAAAPVLGLALAAVAGYRERVVSSSVFLRREEGASLFLVRPSVEEEGQGDALDADRESAGV